MTWILWEFGLVSVVGDRDKYDGGSSRLNSGVDYLGKSLDKETVFSVVWDSVL